MAGLCTFPYAALISVLKILALFWLIAVIREARICAFDKVIVAEVIVIGVVL